MSDLLAILKMWYSFQEFNFRSLWSYFSGFFWSHLLPLLIYPLHFAPKERPFRTECLFQSWSHNFKWFWCYVSLLGFYGVFKIKRPGRSLEQEKQIWMFRDLTHPHFDKNLAHFNKNASCWDALHHVGVKIEILDFDLVKASWILYF